MGGCLMDKISVKRVPRKPTVRRKDGQGRQTDRRTDPISQDTSGHVQGQCRIQMYFGTV